MRQNMKTTEPFRVRKAINSFPVLAVAYQQNSMVAPGEVFFSTLVYTRSRGYTWCDHFVVGVAECDHTQPGNRRVLFFIVSRGIEGFCEFAHHLSQRSTCRETRRIIEGQLEPMRTYMYRPWLPHRMLLARSSRFAVRGYRFHVRRSRYR